MNNLSNTIEDSRINDFKNYADCIIHDLKMPLSATKNSAKLLLKGCFGKLSKKQKDIIELMLESLQFMMELVNTLTLTSILEAGKYKFHTENFELPEITQNIVKQVSNLYSDKKQNVKLTNTMQDKIINADKLLMQRVIFNLLSNANKYGANNSTIEITLNSNGEYTEFSITNTNKFPEYEKNLITFEKYNYKKSMGGTGLGLYLSKLAVERHNGIIIAEYPERNKTRISFRIPKI